MALESASYISQLVATNPPGTDLLSTVDDHIRLVKAVLRGQFPNLGAAAVTPSAVDLNRLLNYPGTTIPSFNVAGQWTQQQNFTLATLTDGSTISWNLQAQQVAVVTLGGNRTLANPTNIVAGGCYTLFIRQDGTGSRLVTFSSAYKFPGGVAPTLTTGASKIDVLTCVAFNGTTLLCNIVQDFAL